MSKSAAAKLIFALTVSAACWQLPMAKNIDNPVFYIWQRDWTPEVSETAMSCRRSIYPLAAEFVRHNGGIKVESVRIPGQITSRHDLTLVYRIHSRLLGRITAKQLVREINKYQVKNIQLDVDCPQSKLKLYGKLVTNLKKLLPERHFSVTVLPCHLSEPDFRDLAGLVDYYVLQLHGIDVPKNINGDCRLIKREIAMPAIRRAKKLALPFKVALPSYAYRLNFVPGSGRFTGLNAERVPWPDKNYKSRLTTIDFKLLHDILFYRPNLSVIWFRLPMPGDSLNLDMSTLNQLENGKIPVPEVKIYCRHTADTRYELMVKTRAVFGGKYITVNLDWQHPAGEFDLYNGTVNRSNNQGFAVLPTKLEILLPGCGKELKAATFFVDSAPVKMEIK